MVDDAELALDALAGAVAMQHLNWLYVSLREGHCVWYRATPAGWVLIHDANNVYRTSEAMKKFAYREVPIPDECRRE